MGALSAGQGKLIVPLPGRQLSPGELVFRHGPIGYEGSTAVTVLPVEDPIPRKPRGIFVKSDRPGKTGD